MLIAFPLSSAFSRLRRIKIAAALMTMLLGAQIQAQDATAPKAPENATGNTSVDFNREIRPLLSDRCFKCHGFDQAARKAELRLDTWKGLTTAIDGRHPIVPGHPDRSELIRRIESDAKNTKMPPSHSGLTLKPSERATLRRWVREGAPFEEHWAFVPPKKSPPPTVRDAKQLRNPIDSFIQAKIEEEGLTGTPEAGKATLARRVYLDLTGLPPTLEELDAHLADKRPDAYEKLVDELLANERHGERMALLWLDAARYADTNGFHHDNVRTAWPYRDWVIQAFRENKPYDDFIIEQLAGDLLPNASESNRIATAFSRMHNINDEGGALDAEYAVEAVCDRIETIATTFMGLTMTCARCHDHKYDPITQEDYYSLYAFFNSVDERGVYPNNLEQARAYPARLLHKPGDLAKKIDVAQKKLAASIAAKTAAMPSFASERKKIEADLRTMHGVVWHPRKVVEVRAKSQIPLVAQDDGSYFLKLPEGKAPPSQDVHSFTFDTERTDLRTVLFDAIADKRLPKKSVGLVAHSNVVITQFVLEVESKRDPKQRRVVPIAHAWADHEQRNGDFDVWNTLQKEGGWALAGHLEKRTHSALLVADEAFGYEGGSRVILHVHYESQYTQHVAGRTRVTLGSAKKSVADVIPMRNSDWFLCGPFKGKDFESAYKTDFGPEKARTIAMDKTFAQKRRWQHNAGLNKSSTHKFGNTNSAMYYGKEFRSPRKTRLKLNLGSDDAIRVYIDGKDVLSKRVFRGFAADQELVEVELPAGTHSVVVKVINQGGPGGFYGKATLAGTRATASSVWSPIAILDKDLRDPHMQTRYSDAWAATSSPTFARLEATVKADNATVAKLEEGAVPVLVMKEREKPKPTYVLERGRYDMANKKRPVTRRPPLHFGGKLPEDAPQNRLGFARWLTDPENPLTARVHVNRIWQMLFGAGIVESSENFGMQADWPSHPALLDWLAATFAEDWDNRALVRRIVCSATYRRSSRRSSESKRLDPKNRLLAHFPRKRLQGEFVRDLALAVSGLLNPKVGGPSVRPYQPDGLWRELSIGGNSNTRTFMRDKGDKLYRRSLYTFWKRTSPSPQMTTFDAPTREFCVVRRGVTNTPLQALVLWNDVQFLEAARLLAQRTLEAMPKQGDEDADGHDTRRIASLFRRCTSRQPDPEESKILSSLLEDLRTRYRAAPKDAAALLAQGEAPLLKDQDAAELAAWMLIANTVLSLDETVVRD